MKLKTLAVALATSLSLVACGDVPATQAHASDKQAIASQATQIQTAEGVSPEVAQTIRTTLEKNYGDQNVKVVSIDKTPVSGLYEVVFEGKRIAYSDATGEYLLLGDLILTKEAKSLTEERKRALNKIDFNNLPLDKAIKEVHGDGSLKVVVFSDPDCSYCKRLDTELAKIKNLTVYTFVMPIPSLHSKAYDKSVQIWCNPNRTKAWADWMRLNKPIPEVAVCENPIRDVMELGAQHGLTGTPTMVFPNGMMQGGYVPMPQLQLVVGSNQK